VSPTITDRILGCFKGIATGDAIGKQTETLSPADITRWYPAGVRGFEGAAGEVIPRYVGNSKHEWRIGETTDDTERTIAVARAIIRDRRVSHESIGREMLGCRKCVHPGVRSLWEFHQANDPFRIATMHDGCGAAIRVAPVGIFQPTSDLDAMVSSAREASISTHGGTLAIAAAAATAAAISGAIDGASPHQILSLAQRAAALAESRWPGSTGSPAVAAAIHKVHADLVAMPVVPSSDIAARWFPDGPLTIVPLALALATVMQSAEEAILVATNIGGDSDSVASIAGGILGARHPETINDQWYRVVDRVNDHKLETLANQLVLLRR
jgi:ADP-ribosylglycohydrolase